MTRQTTRRTIPYRRKREGKTNYKKRLEMLKSRKNRLVIRKTNKHIVAQIANYHPDGDKIVAGVSSKQLESHGWKHSTKNLPASYLTGLLLAKKAKAAGVGSAVLDLGLQTPHKGSRLYAALKGAIDGGLDIPASEEVFPSEDRLKGGHIDDEKVQDSFTKTKSTIEQQ